MSTIEVNLEQFKHIAKEFVEAIEEPKCTLESGAAGFKCLSLAYLGLKEEQPSDLILAQSVYDWATRKWEEKERDFIFGGPIDV